jgi:trk system potassium uptake protein TrkA
MDLESHSFRRLPAAYGGKAIVGNGIDEDALKRAGIEEADVFVAVTQGDNRNVMASQIAKHIFKVPKVVCRIYDPVREEMYRQLGIQTLSPTVVGARMMMELVEN